MASTSNGKSAAIHARLSHPVVDSDGHWVDYAPAFLEYLREAGGPGLLERFRKSTPFGETSLMSKEVRLDRRYPQPPWWGLTTSTPDRATAMLPRMLYERMPELGLDFAVLYPSGPGLFAAYLSDEEVRRASCRAFNTFIADTFKGLEDRLTPAAAIPMHTPAEAIEELQHVKQLGLKAVMVASLVRRRVPYVMRDMPQAARLATWFDMLGMDSAYDYDPFWAKCQELGFSPTFHTGSQGLGLRASVSNWVYNHIGHFAEANDALCKALFLGGVTRRFPKLRFAFLEGGVGYGFKLLNDLIGHFKTRCPESLKYCNPANLDVDFLFEMFEKYGSDTMKRTLDRETLRVGLEGVKPPEPLNEFAACGAQSPEDICKLFVPSFYFGCEAEDRANAWAFNTTVTPGHSRLHAILGTDIGHFDVTDMSTVLAEAWELVEDGLIKEEDFRDFTFANPVRLWAANNPDFFKGTAVERQAAELVSG
jgi:predicted TIM-barrel fold metal-dependent hydrolase